MPGHPAVTLALGASLAALAGFVDATGFIENRGLFVSFMSGNSTQAMVSVAKGELPHTAEFARTIALFVAGVVAAELLATAAGRWRHVVVLALECALLGAALLALPVGAAAAAALLAFAMGAQNAVLHRAGGLKIGLTYVTGTLVSFGRGIAAGLRGAGGWREPAEFATVWLSLAAGSLAGALVASRVVATALGIALAACFAILLAVLALEVAYRRGGGLGEA